MSRRGNVSGGVAVVELTFGEGPLGLRIYSETGSAPVLIRNFYGDPPTPAERCGLLKPGDRIVRVQDQDVSTSDYDVRPLFFFLFLFLSCVCRVHENRGDRDVCV